jgi:hypothetical protein
VQCLRAALEAVEDMFLVRCGRLIFRGKWGAYSIHFAWFGTKDSNNVDFSDRHFAGY